VGRPVLNFSTLKLPIGAVTVSALTAFVAPPTRFEEVSELFNFVNNQRVPKLTRYKQTLVLK